MTNEPNGVESYSTHAPGGTKITVIHEWWTRVVKCGHVSEIHRHTVVGHAQQHIDFDKLVCENCGIKLRCPICKRSQGFVKREGYDPLDAVVLETQCPECIGGDLPSKTYFDKDNKEITRRGK